MGKASWNVTGIVLPSKFTAEQIKFWKPHKTWWQKDYEEKAARDAYAAVMSLRSKGVLIKQGRYEEAHKIMVAKGHAIDSEHKVKRLYLAGKKLHAEDQSRK